MIGSFGKTRTRSPFMIDESGAIPAPGAPMPQPAGGILADAVAKKPGFFDSGGLGQTILNTAFEALTGVPSAAHREQAETRKMGMLQRQLAMQQQAGMQEYAAKKQYDAMNPAPVQPTNTQRTYEWLKSVRPDLADSYLQNEATAPPMVVPNPDGTRTIYPQGAIPRAIPQPQILQQLPPGVKPYTPGGAGSQAPRTFR